jgi:hypothetical protein
LMGHADQVVESLMHEYQAELLASLNENS